MVFSKDQLIDPVQGEWKYKPKPKETQTEFQQSFFKKYQIFFVFILMLVLIAGSIYAWENGLITDFLELVQNV